MSAPTIESLSTTVGQVNQWVYLCGSNFDNQTKVFFGDILCNCFFYSDSSIGVAIPQDAGSSGLFKVESPEGSFVTDIVFTVKTISEAPTVNSFYSSSESSNWIYVKGSNFVTNQTSVEYNGKICDAFVYSPDFCGFSKENESENISSITLITPNGEISFSSN